MFTLTPAKCAPAHSGTHPHVPPHRWVDEEVRPDGRSLGRARAANIGIGAITSCDGSAMVKLGHTTVLAGVTASVGRPPEGSPDQGSLALSLEYAPFATADYRPGRSPEAASVVSERLHAALAPLGLQRQLCVKQGKAAYHVTLAVHVLNADGSVLDAALLACLAALSDTKLPRHTKGGSKQQQKQKQQGKAGAAGGVEDGDSDGEGEGEGAAGKGGVQGRARPPRRITLPALPLSVTCCLHKGKVLVDPTAEEEAIASSAVAVVLTEGGRLQGEGSEGQVLRLAGFQGEGLGLVFGC